MEPSDASLVAGRYQIEREIGRGGMGNVYRARQVALDRTIALKILRTPIDPADAESFEKRFRLEAKTLAQLDHPNIVRIHDFGKTASGRLFLAMELAGGPRLFDLAKGGPMPPDEALPLILQVCAGLGYAHRRGVVHRDLKPSNLLVRDAGDGRRQIKIVDFGLVKLADDEQTITREGLILGSPPCMAPEQVRGETSDHRVDIYALGVLMFRCLTGAYPFQRSNAAATMMAHLNDAPPRMRDVAPDVELPDGLEEIVARCMQKDPADRFDSVDEIVYRLSAILDVPPLSVGSVSVPTAWTDAPERSRRSRVRARLLVAGASLGLAVAAGGVGGALVVGGLRPPPDPPATAPAPIPEVVIEPERVELPSLPPPPVPAPAPARVAPPAPAPATATALDRAEPPPAEATEEVPAPPEDAPPEGYLGLPDDL